MCFCGLLEDLSIKGNSHTCYNAYSRALAALHEEWNIVLVASFGPALHSPYTINVDIQQARGAVIWYLREEAEDLAKKCLLQKFCFKKLFLLDNEQFMYNVFTFELVFFGKQRKICVGCLQNTKNKATSYLSAICKHSRLYGHQEGCKKHVLYALYSVIRIQYTDWNCLWACWGP